MKLLIVEDDDNKQSQISSFLNSQYSDLTLEVARSLKSGLKQIRTFNPDLVLLDMTLPTYDVGPDEPGGSTHALGGREFMRELKRYRLKPPVIVVTQYSIFDAGTEFATLQELDAEFMRTYPEVYRGAVYYHAAIGSWKDHIIKLINENVREGQNAKDSDS